MARPSCHKPRWTRAVTGMSLLNEVAMKRYWGLNPMKATLRRATGQGKNTRHRR